MRPFIPDHDDVARDDLACLDRGEGLFLRVEDPRRAAMERSVVSGELHGATVGGEVAVEDRDATTRLQRRLDRDDHDLALGFDRGVGDLADRAAVDRPRILVQETRLLQLSRDDGATAGAVHVIRVPAAPGLHIGDDRRPRRDPLEVVDREREPEVARDGNEMENGIRRSAGRGHGGDGVLERLARHEGARRDVLPNELDREATGLVGGRFLVPVDRGDPVCAERREPEKVEDPRHRVGSELATAGAGTGARSRLQLMEVIGTDLARRVGSDALVDVADRHLALPVQAGRDRAGVEEDGRDVQAADSHRPAGIGLVAGDELDEPVEQVAARDELDRVRDHLARDE